uniref:Uncharacterized protein n=1 Tax=viral metagenome TaxID=1070528 RepID=A0A6M3KYN9_9ZZZZ
MKKDQFISFLKDPEVETILGNIMFKAISQAMTRTINMESGRDNPGGPPVIKEETWNMVDWIIKYFPHVEGAMRGVQSDVSQAKNASIGVIHRFTMLLEGLNPLIVAARKHMELQEGVIDAGQSYKETPELQGPGS